MGITVLEVSEALQRPRRAGRRLAHHRVRVAHGLLGPSGCGKSTLLVP